MVLDLESGLRLVRRLIVNRSVEGRERHQAPLTIIANEVKQSKFLWPSLRAVAKQSRFPLTVIASDSEAIQIKSKSIS